MLHILWMGIKLILMLLGILLGFLLVLILLLLFCPLRYRLRGEKRGAAMKSASLTGEVSWLLRAILLQADFGEEGLRVTVKVFGLSLDRLRAWKEKRALAKGQVREGSSSRGKTERKRKDEKKEERKAPPGQESSFEGKVDGEGPSDIGEGVLHPDEEAGSPPAATQEEEIGPGEEMGFSPERGFFARLLESIRKSLGRLQELFGRIRALLGRLLKKIQKTRLTFQKIYGNISWWKEFFFHERVQEALGLLRSRLGGLLRHLFPTRLWGEVTFGFEDPSLTGKALAVLGVTIPFHRNRIRVHPLFDCENHFEGEILARGRIYGCYLLWTAVVIYFDKNIKYAINRWKHKEG